MPTLQILVGKSESRVAPTEQELQSNLYEDDDIPPYVTMHGSKYVIILLFII